MKQKWLVVSLTGAAVLGASLLLWRDPAVVAQVKTALGLETAPLQQAKPICSQVIVPAGDCIPQHLAKLPPDPGEPGRATIDGIDSDKDGLRDDLQIYLVENWGHSPRAMAVLTKAAKEFQRQVSLGGDTISKEEARKLAPEVMRNALCYSLAETPEMEKRQAFERLQTKVMNTPQRFIRLYDFSGLLAHQVYTLEDLTPAQACGFDPEAFPINN